MPENLQDPTPPKKERGNGANVIAVNEVGGILLVKHNYGGEQWGLPGGEIERGEAPTHAACEETEEESGLVIDPHDLKLIGWFIQRPKGVVFLFETRKYAGTVITEPNNEVSEARFMSLREIVDLGEKVGLAYRRMILRYIRCIERIDPIPYEGRLADPVEYPKDLVSGEGKFADIVHRV